jgi:hypothetical protein
MLVDGRQGERGSLQETTGESGADSHGFSLGIVATEEGRALDETGVDHWRPVAVQSNLQEILVEAEVDVVPAVVGQVESGLGRKLVGVGRETQTQSAALIGRQQRQRHPIVAHYLFFYLFFRSRKEWNKKKTVTSN